MGKITCLVCLNIFVNGILLPQNTQQDKYINNSLTQEVLEFFSSLKNGTVKNSILQMHKRTKSNGGVIKDTSKTKIEPVKYSAQTEVRNQSEQFKVPLKWKRTSQQIQKDEEVEIDETINWTFSEKERHDGFKRTVPEDNPYAVVIVISIHHHPESSPLCSGSLLTSLWVLTAAHCFDGNVKGVFVFAGTNSPDFNSIPRGGQISVARTYHIHPEYPTRGSHFEFDVGVVKLEIAFRLTRYVNTVQLSKTLWTHNKYKACMMTGFGKVYVGKTDREDNKRKTHYFEVKNSCPCLTDEGHTQVVCSRPRVDYGVCSGDSGAGLICDGKVVAIASLIILIDESDKCSRPNHDLECGSNDTLSVFQKTESYFAWINSTINRASNNCSFGSVVIVVFVAMSILYQNTLHQAYHVDLRWFQT